MPKQLNDDYKVIYLNYEQRNYKLIEEREFKSFSQRKISHPQMEKTCLLQYVFSRSRTLLPNITRLSIS